MRVILKTPPVPTTFTDPRSGLLHEGKASLQVIVYEPGEVARRGDGAERSVPTLADWRKNRDSSGAIVVHPGAAMAAVAPGTNFAGQVLIAGGYPQNGSPNGQSGCYPSYFWQPYSFLGLWHWPWTWSVAECQRQMFANRPNDFYLYSGSPVNLNAGGDILQIGSSSGATTPDHSRILVGAGYDVMTGLWQSNLQDQHTTDEYHLVWDYNIDPSWTLWAWWVTW